MIIPAIIAKDFEELQSKLAKIDGLVSWAQIDVMDGVFVPPKTWDNPADLENISTVINLEAHLMIANPEEIIDDGANIFKIGGIIPSFRRNENAVHHVNLRPRNKPVNFGELALQFFKIFSDNRGNNHAIFGLNFFLSISSISLILLTYLLSGLNFAESQALTIFFACIKNVLSAARHNTFILSSSLPFLAIFGVLASPARIPSTLFAAIQIPMPEPQIKIPPLESESSATFFATSYPISV